MTQRKHFKAATKSEIDQLINMLKSTAIEWNQANGFSGLSEDGSHNVYSAIENAILREHEGIDEVQCAQMTTTLSKILPPEKLKALATMDSTSPLGKKIFFEAIKMAEG